MSIALLLVHASVAAAPDITGRWLIDAAKSTNAADELKGIREKKFRIDGDERHPPSAESSRNATQTRYWQTANEGEEWQHSRELAHAGPLQRLLESANLEIVREGDAYLFIYADGYEREVHPNPQGRVFTASGDELVKSDIGYTLAYRDGAALTLETRIRHGGKLLEQVSLSDDGDTLTIDIEIDRRDWKWVAKSTRVFRRAR